MIFKEFNNKLNEEKTSYLLDSINAKRFTSNISYETALTVMANWRCCRGDLVETVANWWLGVANWQWVVAKWWVAKWRSGEMTYNPAGIEIPYSDKIFYIKTVCRSLSKYMSILMGFLYFYLSMGHFEITVVTNSSDLRNYHIKKTRPAWFYCMTTKHTSCDLTREITS